ncbi:MULTISPECIES: sugar phosphate isomerase/epimerase family protein [Anaerotruncus]|jgi:sugar phosphate isomerase/epimerase|uniref:sugar phosphate isomerase/epimerase family protein n=1 Tax=Anaerotruncus TaxID=244127 RepID=UPI00082A63F8|nr:MULTISPECIES: sugar phosphate isomerase/epimerase family protein [Anaerotruncus]RGX53616.1 sugar phosphate isomerase/epimerase [Anaerotruncus sp. AF02-27]
MKLAVTGKNQAGKFAPLVFRGSYDEMIPAAAQIGYDAMELHIHNSAELDRAALKKLFDENGITLSSIGTGSAYAEDHLSLSSDDPDSRRGAVERMKDHIVTAQDYDAVVIIGLIKGMIRDASSKEACMRHLSESLHELVDFAKAHKVVLVLEILNRYESDFLNTIAEGVEFIKDYDTDYLKLHIDTYHMNIEETHPGENIRAARGLIGHCHIADSDRWYAGHAHYDFKETVRALRDIGYDRALSVESFLFPNSEESARRSFETLKEACK